MVDCIEKNYFVKLIDSNENGRLESSEYADFINTSIRSEAFLLIATNTAVTENSMLAQYATSTVTKEAAAKFRDRWVQQFPKGIEHLREKDIVAITTAAAELRDKVNAAAASPQKFRDGITMSSLAGAVASTISHQLSADRQCERSAALPRSR